MVVSESNPNYSSVDNLLLSKDGSILLRCPQGRKTTLTIPESVVEIGREAVMACLELKTIQIPLHVQNIGIDAFLNNKDSTTGKGLTQVMFVGRTIQQVREMANYPWGLDESIIYAEDKQPPEEEGGGEQTEPTPPEWDPTNTTWNYDDWEDLDPELKQEFQ